MEMIESHLDQISLSAIAIAELPFPPPKSFTNALLHSHDITALIRDTESHERALFSVIQPETGSFEPTTRREATYYLNADNPKPSFLDGLKSNTAVGRILGGDVMKEIRRVNRTDGKSRSDVDVNALLDGAERLCGIYPIAGALGKIQTLRSRHEQLAASIAYYEEEVAKQALQLEEMNRPGRPMYDEDDEIMTTTESEQLEHAHNGVEDIQREEAEMRELEEKKRGLEARVSGMERDLGGLMR